MRSGLKYVCIVSVIAALLIGLSVMPSTTVADEAETENVWVDMRGPGDNCPYALEVTPGGVLYQSANAKPGEKGVWKYESNRWIDTRFPVNHWELCPEFEYDSAHDVLYYSGYSLGVWQYVRSRWICLADGEHDPDGESPHLVKNLAHDPEHAVLYAAEGWGPGGVWKYKNKNWSNLPWIPVDPFLLSITDLLYDEVNDVLCVATNKGFWGYENDEWSLFPGSSTDQDLRSIEYDPIHDVFYAWIVTDDYFWSVWRYQDGVWEDTYIPEAGYPSSTGPVFDQERNILYAARNHGVVWEYENREWSQLHDSIPVCFIGALSLDPTSGALYMSLGELDPSGPVPPGVWKHEGGELIRIPSGISDATVWSFEEHPQEDIVYAGTGDSMSMTVPAGVWKCENGEWSDTGGSFDLTGWITAIWCLTLDAEHDVLYASSLEEWGRAWKYESGEWELISQDIADLGVFRIEFDDERDVLYVSPGFPENGVLTYKDGVWGSLKGPGDGETLYSPAFLLYEPTTETLFVTTGLHGVWQYDCRYQTWESLGGPKKDGDFLFGYELAYDQTNNILYVGTDSDGVWKYEKDTWSNTGGDISEFRIKTISFDSKHNVLYASAREASPDSEGFPRGIWKLESGEWEEVERAFPYWPVNRDILYSAKNDCLYTGYEFRGAWKYGSFPGLNITAYLQGYYQGDGEQREAQIDVDLLDTNMQKVATFENIPLDERGKAYIDLEGIPQGKYYVAVIHHNHLAVVSSKPYVYTGDNQVEVDFPQEGAAYGPPTTTYRAMHREPDGSYSLWGGDAVEDGLVDESDLFQLMDDWETSDWRSDLDGDGIVFKNDHLILLSAWKHRSFYTPNPSNITEFVPNGG